MMKKPSALIQFYGLPPRKPATNQLTPKQKRRIKKELKGKKKN
jgi:hypothetical protein